MMMPPRRHSSPRLRLQARRCDAVCVQPMMTGRDITVTYTDIRHQHRCHPHNHHRLHDILHEDEYTNDSPSPPHTIEIYDDIFFFQMIPRDTYAARSACARRPLPRCLLPACPLPARRPATAYQPRWQRRCLPLSRRGKPRVRVATRCVDASASMS